MKSHISGRPVVAFFLCFASFATAIYGQGLTGRINGMVADPDAAAVAAAKVWITNPEIGLTRESATDATGAFMFVDLLPGTYTLTVEAPGFKRYQQSGVSLSATERVTLRGIVLQIGQVTETLSVTGEAARVQTQSSERSGLVDTQQLQDLALKGRDYLETMQLLPGVTDSVERDAPGFTITNAGNGGLIGLNINGNKEHTVNVTIDGISALETGSQTGPWISPSLDAIGEMKVLLTNYQAEYGRSSGGTINVVIKNGTRDYHGSAYYFYRDRALNANKFFNNRQGLGKDPYHYNDVGYTIGGPLRIPKLLERRDKLFFFWSQEYMPKKVPQAQIRRTMPSDLERSGDFSQTLDTNGRVIRINDPLNGGNAFPGNVIPANRIDHAGQGLLNVFAKPNAVDPNRTFNYVDTPVLDNPWHQELLRVDYNVSSRTLFYFRLVQSGEDRRTTMDGLGALNWGQFPTNYGISGHGLVTTLIHTFSPSLVNEFTFGVNRGTQRLSPQDQAALDANDRRKLGLDLPQFYPQINPLNLIPNATFGGVSNAPALSIESRFPYIGNGNVWNWSDNLSKTYGKHSFKFGLYIEKSSRNGPRPSTATGAFSFNRDVNNPFDTNYAFSNAILGSVASYAESDLRPFSRARYQNYEWFAQDSWRATRRLSFEIGVRFYKIVPTYLGEGRGSRFDPTLYDPAQAPAFIQPYRATPSSARVGRNPITGETVSPVLIGTYAPGSGNPYNGMRVDEVHVIESPRVIATPRIGFAWDIFGDGKMAVRGGFGTYLDRVPDTFTTNFTQLPPLVNTYTVYNTTISQLLNTRLTLSPSSVFGMQGKYEPPQGAYNWSFGIQRDIGFGMVLDVAYVGNVGRHLQQVRDLNATPYGTNYLPSSADPTSPGAPLPANFLRPIKGYAGITYYECAWTSNYNSLQTQFNKRFSKNLKFGASYTWSKAMNYGDSDSAVLNPFIDPRVRNYGKAGYDRTHNLTVNYIYSLPRPFARWNNSFSRVTLKGWQLSGITSFFSGAPTGFSYSLAGTSDITGATGGGVDSRVIMVGNPNLPYGERTRERAFDTSAVAPPLVSDFGIGNAPKDAVRGPGRNKWNISLFKTIPLGSESRRAQIRFETYNTLNHPQFSAVNTAARFDTAGNQINPDFGWYTATGQARIMQLGIKFLF